MKLQPRIARWSAPFGLLSLLLLIAMAFAKDAMKPQAVEQPAFEVIGLETRTNNARESQPGGAIPQTWQTFYMEGTMDRIPGRVDDSTVAVYTDYASDANGDYTFVLGTKVKPGTKPPAGLVSKQVPGGKFEGFTSEQGELQVVIPKLWQAIAEYFGASGSPARAYRADYELYPAAIDPNNSSAKVYVGIK